MDAAVITFKPHPDAKSRKSSAVALIKFLLKINTPEVSPKHLEKLIDAMLWTITEADGKYNTRHRSDRALRCSDNNMLAHGNLSGTDGSTPVANPISSSLGDRYVSSYPPLAPPQQLRARTVMSKR